ncbi:MULTISPECIES: MvdC/MvdD family ATP grasp protein [Actinoalloteichus]|uniref:MvdC/MvdD family ATP grasp protein n=1 Tax=Actinoalloteichus TaxID=65496 RepID=UPI0009508D23|nr:MULTISPECIES: hypothetical protein [Actinoalloteichus]APU23623.1 hypothetical protein UA75_28260 [Actinoalloteichus sp. GBA129-24]
MSGSVLVITRRFDPTADDVIVRLSARDVPILRLDLADFPREFRLSGRIASGCSGWSGRVSGTRRGVSLTEVGAVWYRKPSQFHVLDAMSRTEETWSIREARAGMGGILATLRCTWINHPHRNVIADQKPLQLVTADEVGLAIPETIITNDPVQARSFVAGQATGAVYKSLRGGPRSEGAGRWRCTRRR